VPGPAPRLWGGPAASAGVPLHASEEGQCRVPLLASGEGQSRGPAPRLSVDVSLAAPRPYSRRLCPRRLSLSLAACGAFLRLRVNVEWIDAFVLLVG